MELLEMKFVNHWNSQSTLLGNISETEKWF